MKNKIVLEIPFYSTNIQGLIYDFSTYCKILSNQEFQIKISESFCNEINGKGAFGRVLLDNGKNILFDLQDNPGQYEFYQNYDYIFKRSYLENFRYSANVIPYGLRFDNFCGLWLTIFRNPILFLKDKRNLKELTRTFFNVFGINYQGYNNLQRRWGYLSKFKSNTEYYSKKILFSTRLWLNKESGVKISQERLKIKNILNERDDVLYNSVTQVSQSEYFKLLKEVNIVIINNGLHDVPGLRFSELLIMGKLIITLPINVNIPGLIKGEHYLEANLESLSELLNTISIEEIDRIRKNGQEFACRFLAPAKRIEFLFSIIK